MKTLTLIVRVIFKGAIIKDATFVVDDTFEFEKLPLFLQYFVLKFIRLYLKINYVLLNTYYRFWICGCFGLRAFYWFAFHGVILLRDDDLFKDTQRAAQPRRPLASAVVARLYRFMHYPENGIDIIVIGKEKNLIYFVNSSFSLFRYFVVGLKQIMRVKPLRYALIVYVIFIINSCFSYSYFESSRQDLFKSGNCSLLLAEKLNKGFSDISFFMDSLGATVKDHLGFKEWLSKIIGIFHKMFFCASDFLKQMIGIGRGQDSQNSDNNLVHYFLFGAVVYSIFHIIFNKENRR